MGVGVWAVTGALAILAALYWRWLLGALRRRRRLLSLAARLPGPPALPLLGNTHQFKINRVAFSYQLEEICCRYGADGIFCLWIGPEPLIIVTTAETSEPVLSSNELITKTDLGYHYLRQWVGDGLLLSTGPKWRRRRKMLTPTFHYGILQGFVDIQAEQALLLIRKLREMAAAGVPFDIFPFIGRCALDIICESAMGVGVRAQEERESAYVKAVLSMTEAIFKRDRMPWLWLKPVWYGLGYGRKWDADLALLTGFTQKVILERRAALAKEASQQGLSSISELEVEGKRFAFLDLLLLMQAKEGLSDADIAEEVDVFMFEGHDTTSSGMGWTLFMLGHHPKIQEKVFEELDAIFGESDRPATIDDLKEMKYLERVIKETMRLYPPVPIFGREVTEETRIGKYTLPLGSNVVVMPFLIHRDRQQWGSDAETFDPDRFLPERNIGRHPYSFVPFSAGPRNCIGQKFALMEEKAVVSRVVREFRVESLESPRSVRPIPDLILRPAEKFLVRLHPRR